MKLGIYVLNRWQFRECLFSPPIDNTVLFVDKNIHLPIYKYIEIRGLGMSFCCISFRRIFTAEGRHVTNIPVRDSLVAIKFSITFLLKMSEGVLFHVFFFLYLEFKYGNFSIIRIVLVSCWTKVNFAMTFISYTTILWHLHELATITEYRQGLLLIASVY